MRVVGVVAEYNPFHSGHAYHLAQAKALAGADYALVAMSGDFVQRGEPALFPKRLRAKWALENGADLVLALPTVFSLTSAAGFARGALALLGQTRVVDAVCFGSECGDAGLLQKALAALGEPSQAAACQAALRQGKSFPAAQGAALNAAIPGLSCGSNDILALEYLRALQSLGSPMEPIALKRAGAGHDEAGLFGPHASATALRGCIAAGDWPSLTGYLPPNVRTEAQALWEDGQARYFARLSQAILFALRRLSKEGLAELGEVREGLENVLYKACRRAATVEELLSLAKTRRYPMARLKRACLCALLGITGADLAAAEAGAYLRVLGARRGALPLLGRLGKSAGLPLVSRYADAASLSPGQRRLFELDRFAAETAALAAQTPHPAPSDFGEPLILVD